MKPNPMRDTHQRKLAEKTAKLRAEAAQNLSKSRSIRGARVQESISDILDDNPTIPSTSAQQIELRMHVDMQRLKAIQSVQQKCELKAELLPSYHAWIEGTLAVSPAPQNDMLVHLMVWALDASDYRLAVTIAEHCLLNDMVMPAPFTRNLGTVFGEQLADGLLEYPDTSPDFADVIEHAIDMLKPVDMPDEVRAKLYKAFAISIQTHRPKDALIAFETALHLNKAIGVKKTIEELTRAIKRGDTLSAPDTQSGSQDNTKPTDSGTDPASTALPNSTPEVPQTLESILGLPEASDTTTKPADTATPAAAS